jgi:hypothetical protein
MSLSSRHGRSGGQAITSVSRDTLLSRRSSQTSGLFTSFPLGAVLLHRQPDQCSHVTGVDVDALVRYSSKVVNDVRVPGR